MLQPHQLQSRVQLSMEIFNKWDQDPKALLPRTVRVDKTRNSEDKEQSKQQLPRSRRGLVKAKEE